MASLIMVFFATFSLAVVASLLAALVIISTQRLHGRLTHDSQPGVQKLHSIPPPGSVAWPTSLPLTILIFI